MGLIDLSLTSKDEPSRSVIRRKMENTERSLSAISARMDNKHSIYRFLTGTQIDTHA